MKNNTRDTSQSSIVDHGSLVMAGRVFGRPARCSSANLIRSQLTPARDLILQDIILMRISLESSFIRAPVTKQSRCRERCWPLFGVRHGASRLDSEAYT